MYCLAAETVPLFRWEQLRLPPAIYAMHQTQMQWTRASNGEVGSAIH